MKWGGAWGGGTPGICTVQDRWNIDCCALEVGWIALSGRVK